MSKESWNRRRSAGQMANDRRAWISLPKFDFILFVGEDITNPEKNPKEIRHHHYPPIYIQLRIPGKRNPTTIQLSAMTEEELDVFEKFMLHAINRARPTVRELDRIAQEAFENGDDSFERLYRPEPRFVDRESGDFPDIPGRKRPVTEHGEGVSSGPEGPDEYGNSNADLEQGGSGVDDSIVPDGD